jgi:hypothetical protein
MMEWGYKRKMLDAGLYECGFLISDCRIKNQKYWIKRMRISDFGPPWCGFNNCVAALLAD